MRIDGAVLGAVERVMQESESTAWNVFEDVAAGRAWLIGIFSSAKEARDAWPAVRALLPRRGLAEPEWRELADQDWRESYKAHFKAWRCGTLHWVPEWERTTRRIPPGNAAVYLDPGLAFGTGNHETTRLCCRRLVEFARAQASRRGRDRSWRVIDAGCGSGILAISAAKLGCREVFAFDNDPEAVAVARKNVRRNRVVPAIRVAVGGIGPMLRRRQAELVLANIQADVLVAFSDDLLGAVVPGGWLVLSGILTREIPAVRSTIGQAAGRGWRVASRRLGEWADLRLVAPEKTSRNQQIGSAR